MLYCSYRWWIERWKNESSFSNVQIRPTLAEAAHLHAEGLIQKIHKNGEHIVPILNNPIVQRFYGDHPPSCPLTYRMTPKMVATSERLKEATATQATVPSVQVQRSYNDLPSEAALTNSALHAQNPTSLVHSSMRQSIHFMASVTPTPDSGTLPQDRHDADKSDREAVGRRPSLPFHGLRRNTQPQQMFENSLDQPPMRDAGAASQDSAQLQEAAQPTIRGTANSHRSEETQLSTELHSIAAPDSSASLPQMKSQSEQSTKHELDRIAPLSPSAAPQVPTPSCNPIKTVLGLENQPRFERGKPKTPHPKPKDPHIHPSTRDRSQPSSFTAQTDTKTIDPRKKPTRSKKPPPFETYDFRAWHEPSVIEFDSSKINAKLSTAGSTPKANEASRPTASAARNNTTPAFGYFELESEARIQKLERRVLKLQRIVSAKDEGLLMKDHEIWKLKKENEGLKREKGSDDAVRPSKRSRLSGDT